MAYKSKYYDPVKAHEYYEKHKKLKGRSKKTSTADLSEAGKIAAKEVKEQLQAELKAALKKVKRGNTAERKRLRELYQKKYEAELEEIRKDPTMLKAPKQKKEKQPKSAKTSGGSKASSKSTKTETKAKTKTETKAKAKAKTKAETKAETKEKLAEETSVVAESEKIINVISQLRDKFSLMSDEQKATAKDLIKKLITFYKM